MSTREGFRNQCLVKTAITMGYLVRFSLRYSHVGGQRGQIVVVPPHLERKIEIILLPNNSYTAAVLSHKKTNSTRIFNIKTTTTLSR